MKSLSTIKEKMNKNANEQLVHFMVLLYSVSTGEVTPQQIFKIGGETGYGEFSKSFWKIYMFGVDWKYGLAKASEIISSIKNNRDDQISRFLLRLAQVIRLGDKLSDYFKMEMELVLQNFYTTYQRNMESLKMILGMYTAIMSISAFMISATSIINMLTGEDSTSTFMITLIGVIISLGMFIMVMHVMFPRDILVNDDALEADRLKIWIYLAIFSGIGITAIAFTVKEFPTLLGIAIAGFPFLIPGHKARKLEMKIKRIDEWYPPFIKDFGSVFNTVGTIKESLRAMMRSDFDEITPHLSKFLNRSLNKIPYEVSLELFTKESGSAMIKSGNTILKHSINKGSDMTAVGMAIHTVFTRINELRKIREQTTKSFLSMIFILHILTLMVFAFMTRLSFIFTDLFSQMEGAQAVFSFNPINPILVESLLPTILVAFSAMNALAIKVGEGGLYRTGFYHFGVLMIIGGFALFGADFIMQSIVSNQSINLSGITENG